MNTWQRQAGRALAVTGLIAGVVYLGWRVLCSGNGAPWWLSVPTLSVEALGVVATALLTWAMWWSPLERWNPDLEPYAALDVRASFEAEQVTVMVRAGTREDWQVRATLIAARRLHGVGDVVLVDPRAQPTLTALAAALGIRHLSRLSEPTSPLDDAVDPGAPRDTAVAPGDLNGLELMGRHCRTPLLLVLDAGDIAHPDILVRLRPFIDPSAPADRAAVAIVQAVGVTAAGVAAEDHSVEYLGTGRHRLDVDRRVLGPSLGARGVALFAGSGALVRTDALCATTPGTASPELAQLSVMAQLFASGWLIVTPVSTPLVAVSDIANAEDLEDTQVAEASAARSAVWGAGGALRSTELTGAQRLALLAWAVRPLAGIRRSAITALVCAVLLSGRMPFSPSATAVFGLWLPWLVCTSLGLSVMSGGMLRVGDRTRGASSTIGASWRGWATPNGRVQPRTRALGEAFGLHHGVSQSAAAAALCIALGLRGISDSVSYTLRPVPGAHLALLLPLALGVLCALLETLQLLVHPTSSRRAVRLTTGWTCTLEASDNIIRLDAGIVDITPVGAGLIVEPELAERAGIEIGDIVRCRSVRTTAPTGGDHVLIESITGVVRNARLDLGGRQRFGLRFVPAASQPQAEPQAETEVDAANRATADALSELCVIQPALTRLTRGITPVGPPPDAQILIDATPTGSRRWGLRTAALLAVAGAVASSTTHPALAVADAEVAGRVGVEGAVVTVACALEAGADGRFGTSDDLWAAPRSAVSGPDGTYELTVTGTICWEVVALPAGSLVRVDDAELAALTTPQVIDPSTGRGVSLTPVSEAVDARTVEGVDGTVHGSVVTDGGAPVPGAHVTLYDAGGTVLDRVATEPDGSFVVGLPIGTPARFGVSDLPVGLMPITSSGPLGFGQLFESGGGWKPAAGVVRVTERGSRSDDVGGDSDWTDARTVRLLPAPSSVELRTSMTSRAQAAQAVTSTSALVVIALGLLLGLAVVLGSLMPYSRRQPRVVAAPALQSGSPDFAIR